MRRITFPTGLNEVALGWMTASFQWMLVTGAWGQNEATQVFVADIVAVEFAATGYTRRPVTAPTRTVVLPAVAGAAGRVVCGCADPNFGVMSGAGVAAALVLYRFVTNDADSPLVAAFPCAYTADGVLAAVFDVSAGAVIWDTLCTGGF